MISNPEDQLEELDPELLAAVTADIMVNLPIIHHPESSYWLEFNDKYTVIYDCTFINGRAIVFKDMSDVTQYVMRVVTMEFCFEQSMKFESAEHVDKSLMEACGGLYEMYQKAAIKISGEQLAYISSKVPFWGLN